MLSDLLIKKIIRETKMLKATDAKELEKTAEEKKISLETALLQNKTVSEDQLYRQAALTLEMPFVDLGTQIIRKDILYIVPEPIATTHHVVPFDKTDTEISLATTDPDDLKRIFKR